MEDANLDLTALLLQVATQRSKAAYGQLFHYFAPRIRHYGLRHLRSEARAMELVQDTLLAVWQKPPYTTPKRGPPPGSTLSCATSASTCYGASKSRKKIGGRRSVAGIGISGGRR